MGSAHDDGMSRIGIIFKERIQPEINLCGYVQGVILHPENLDNERNYLTQTN